MPELDFFATAPRYLESLLAEELQGLGLATAKETRGGAAFSARLGDAYRICLWSRIANRILLTLARCPAPDAEALYAGALDIPWEEHLAPEQTFAVQVDGVQAQIGHSHYAALRIKDAIVDRFRAQTGSRPSVAPVRPGL